MDNGTNEQIVTHLENEIELNGSEAPDELQINTLSQHATKANADRHKPTYHHCKKPGHYTNQCRLLKRQKEMSEDIKIILETKTVAQKFYTKQQYKREKQQQREKR